MGLDTVELVMAFEEEFGIAITDEAASRMATPGHVADYVMARLPAQASQSCRSQAAFHRLRAALMATCGVPRQDIRLQSPLAELLKSDVRGKWTQLGEAIGDRRFPRLEYPRWFMLLIGVVMPAAMAGALWGAGAPFLAAVLAFVLLLIAAMKWAEARGTQIPPRLKTVESLLPYVADVGLATWSRETALAKIIDITAEQLGLHREDISENSHFVHDLGAD